MTTEQGTRRYGSLLPDEVTGMTSPFPCTTVGESAGTKYGQAQMILPPAMDRLCRETHYGDEHKRKSKILCTMGPSCWDVDMLVKMIDCGMNVARLNFSHGDHEAHGNTVKNLMAAKRERPQKQVGLLLDTKGPEIRSGFFKQPEGGEKISKIHLKKGEILRLTTDYDFLGDNTCLACTYKALPTSVKPGNAILMADGSVTLEVKECGPDYVDCFIVNNASIGERKNMNLPGVKVDLPVLGEKDKNDILNFAIPHGCNFIAASFVQCANDVHDIRNLMGARGRHIQIISKIENEEGLKNFDEILDASDSIMVARGDLGMEIPTEKVFLAQKMMIAKCNMAGKPVITATQMLESMTGNPRPTRAEASDVANAILDGSDCVMLSGETAGGSFPLEAVTNMARICEEAEHYIAYQGLQTHIKTTVLEQNQQCVGTAEAVACAAVESALFTDAKLIIALTESGSTARLIAKYRPRQPILALCAADSTLQRLQICRGVVVLKVPSFQGTDHVIKNALGIAKEMGLVVKHDRIVAVHGIKEEMSGSTNLLKVLTVD